MGVFRPENSREPVAAFPSKAASGSAKVPHIHTVRRSSAREQRQSDRPGCQKGRMGRVSNARKVGLAAWGQADIPSGGVHPVCYYKRHRDVRRCTVLIGFSGNRQWVCPSESTWTRSLHIRVIGRLLVHMAELSEAKSKETVHSFGRLRYRCLKDIARPFFRDCSEWVCCVSRKPLYFSGGWP